MWAHHPWIWGLSILLCKSRKPVCGQGVHALSLLLRLSENKIPGDPTWQRCMGKVKYVEGFTQLGCSGWTEPPWGVIRADFGQLVGIIALDWFSLTLDATSKRKSILKGGEVYDTCGSLCRYSMFASEKFLSKQIFKKQSRFFFSFVTPEWSISLLPSRMFALRTHSRHHPGTSRVISASFPHCVGPHFLVWSSTSLICVRVPVEQVLYRLCAGVPLNQWVEIANTWKCLYFPFTLDDFCCWNSR